jgi:hypothetical protein
MFRNTALSLSAALVLSVSVLGISTQANAAAVNVTIKAPAPAGQAYGSDGKVIGAHPDQNKPSQLHWSMSCPMDISTSDCEKIKMMLPID